MNAKAFRADIAPGLIFLFGIASKFISLWQAGHDTPETPADAISGLSLNQLIYVGLALDLTGLMASLFVREPRSRGCVLIWISSAFILYHLCGWLVVSRATCDCLSGIGKLLGAPIQVYALLPLPLSLYLLYHGLTLMPLDIQSAKAAIRGRFPALPRLLGTRWFRILFLLITCVGVTAFILERAPLTSAVEFQGDEQLELMKARLLSQGFPLYREIWSDQPPLLTFVYAGLLNAGPGGATLPRMFSCFLFLGLLYFAGRGLALRFGVMAGLIFILLLPTVPEVMSLALSATQEIPAVTLAYLGALLGQSHLARRSRFALWSCLGLYLLAFSIKFMALLFLIPLLGQTLWLACTHPTARKGSLHFVAALLSVPLAGLVLDWCLFGTDAISQMINTHHGFRHVDAVPDPGSFAFALSDLLEYPALYFASFCAIVWLLFSGRWKACVYEILLMLLIGGIALVYKPWWSYYQLELGIALCLITAIGLADAFRAGWSCASPGIRPVSVRPVMIVWLCTILTMVAILAGARQWRSNLAFLEDRLTIDDSEWVQFLRPFRGKVKWAFSPQSIFVFHAGLSVPPKLAVLSLKRFWTGQISVARIRSLLLEYQPEVIAVDHRHDQGPLHCVRELNYQLVCEGRECLLYVRSDFTNRIASRPGSSITSEKFGPNFKPIESNPHQN